MVQSFTQSCRWNSLLAFSLLFTDILTFRFEQHQYEVIPERATAAFYNKSIVYRYNVVPFRNDNKGRIYFNITLGFKREINRLIIIEKVEKFISNEYRPFPIEIAIDACDEFSKNLYGFRDTLKTFSNMSAECPIKKGVYKFFNVYPISETFPPNIPSGRYLIRYDFNDRDIKAFAMDYFIRIRYFKEHLN